MINTFQVGLTCKKSRKSNASSNWEVDEIVLEQPPIPAIPSEEVETTIVASRKTGIIENSEKIKLGEPIKLELSRPG